MILDQPDLSLHKFFQGESRLNRRFDQADTSNAPQSQRNTIEASNDQPRDLQWQDLTHTIEKAGDEPKAILWDELARLAKLQGPPSGQIAKISISHDGDYATAVCLAAEEPMQGDVGGEAGARDAT